MKARILIMAMTFAAAAAGLTGTASAAEEPNIEIATQWWPELRHVVTPVGWRDHLHRYHIVYDGTILARPPRKPTRFEAEKAAGQQVERACGRMEVSRAAYYQGRTRGPSARQLEDEDEVRVTADQALQTSLDALRGAGLRADGVTARGKAVESMVSMVKEREARQAVVITRPHAVADTLQRDWATRAQDQLGIPVLHL